MMSISKETPTLVTGSRGFIGRELCKRLRARGNRVFEINSENGGVCRPENLMAFAELGIRHVFHLAGKSYVPESWETPAMYFEVNTAGTQNVLEFCRRARCSLSYISSYLYGIPDHLPIDETAAVRRNSPYANSKFLAEELCRYYAKEFGIPCTILRPFNVFGPGQDRRMLIPHILEQVLAGGEIHVKDLTPRRDYLYLDDFIDVLLLTYPRNAGWTVYNVGSGVSYSITDILAMLQPIAGTQLPVMSDDENRRNEIPDVRADTGLLRRTFGWNPKIGMEEGLRILISDERHRRRLTPINKGNYSMEPPEREEHFDRIRGEGWPDEYRRYRQMWVELPRRQEVRDYPLQVDLELSSDCNLSCPMCFTRTTQFHGAVDRRFMDKKLFDRIIDEISGHVPAVRVSLRGESTLHPDFVECIRYAKSRGIPEVSFLTNGSTMTPEFFESVMRAGADWITFSVDGIGTAYERIRRPLKADETLQKLRDIQQIRKAHGRARPAIKVQTIWPAIRDNPQAYYDAVAPCCDFVAVNPLIDYLGKDDDIVFVDEFVCPQLYQRVLIGADGRALLCSNDEMAAVSPGDATRQTIHEIWHGDVLSRVRATHLRPRGFMEIPVCRHCYLPRKTEDSETATIHGRVIRIRNYVNRRQEIGT